MQSILIGKNYCLRLPDGRALGHVRVERLVDSWAEGAFAPGPAFKEFKELFDREAKLRHDQIIPLWEQAAGAIESLQIQVVEEGKDPIQPRPRVFVEGNEVILGGHT
jgi:hypothetical protein